MSGLTYLTTLQLQFVWGWAPSIAAIAMLPMVVVLLGGGRFVGPFVERADLFRLEVPGGQDDDGRLGQLLELADDLDSVGIGQAEIEQDQLEIALLGRLQGAGCGVGVGDGMALRQQHRRKRGGDRRLVVDQQDLQSQVPIRSCGTSDG